MSKCKGATTPAPTAVHECVTNGEKPGIDCGDCKQFNSGEDCGITNGDGNDSKVKGNSKCWTCKF